MGETTLGYIEARSCRTKGVDAMQNRVRDLREDHDLTQQKVADALGITQRKYSYVETGTQPLTDELLVKLARFYGVSTDYILCLTDKSNG